MVALFPYHDEPLTPKLAFIYLLWPGWAIAGRDYHVRLWQEALAVAINGLVCSLIVLCALTWYDWRGGKAPSSSLHRLIATVPVLAVLWFMNALNLGLLSFANVWVLVIPMCCTLIWAVGEIGYALYKEIRYRANDSL